MGEQGRALTGRKRRPLRRELGTRRDACLLVIATEGEKTEPQYFAGCFAKSSRVQIHVLPSEEGKSSPRHVAQRLRQFRRDFDLGKNDQLWLVIDTDRVPEKQLAEVASEAMKTGARLAVSRPGFELWLLMHLTDVGPEVEGKTSDGLKKHLKSLLGSYNPSNLDAPRFRPGVRTASARAKAMDLNPAERWPNSTGTRVYLLVDEILKLTSVA
jgi:hypothetical protein